MAVFSIQVPDGRTLDIEAADEATAMNGAQQWYAANQRPTIPTAPAAPAPSPLQLVDDFVRRTANAATFGFADKLAAKGDEITGRGGSYEQNIVKEREQTKQAATNLGVPASLAADILGGVGGGLALGAVGLSPVAAAGPGFANRFIGGALEGAMQGALQTFGESDAPVTAEQLGYGALSGGGVGAAVPVLGAAARRVITPLTSTLSPQAQRQVATLAREGVEVTPAQATGSQVARVAENLFEAIPGGGGSPRLGRQQEQVGIAAFKKAGGEGLPGDLERGARMAELQQNYKDVFAKHFVLFDKNYDVDLNKAIKSFNKGSGFEEAKQKVVNDVITDLQSIKGRALTGENYQDLRSKITSIKSGYTNDARMSGILGELRDALDSQAERWIKPISKNDWELLQKTNRQYAVLKTLNRAADMSAQGAEGIITPAALKSANRAAMGRQAQAMGRGELSELANAAASVMSQTTPASSRSFASRAIGAGGLLGAGALGVYGAAELGGPGYAAASVGAPVAASLLYFSPLGQRYLRNQIMPGSTMPASVQQALTGGLIGVQGGVEQR